MDIISAIEFDTTGGHLATGDRGGRVVLFERTDVRDVCLLTTCFISYVVLFPFLVCIFSFMPTHTCYCVMCSMEIEEI